MGSTEHKKVMKKPPIEDTATTQEQKLLLLPLLLLPLTEPMAEVTVPVLQMIIHLQELGMEQLRVLKIIVVLEVGVAIRISVLYIVFFCVKFCKYDV